MKEIEVKMDYNPCDHCANETKSKNRSSGVHNEDCTSCGYGYALFMLGHYQHAASLVGASEILENTPFTGWRLK